LEPPSRTASAFIDKVFQVRFEAPPLVLSDWRTYLMGLLREAFPDEDELHLRAVLRVRSRYPGVEIDGMVAREAPTPRQLKQFVNQVGVIRRQRGDISLVHMAYYTLLKRDGKDIPAQLIAESLPHKKLAYVFEGHAGEDLAALHFGAAQDLAQQLLLRPALEGAFATGDAETVAQLSERAGFVDVLEDLNIDDMAADGGIELTRAVAVLGASKVFDKEGVDEWARHELEPLATRTGRWRVEGRDTGVGLAILLNRITAADDESLTRFLEKVEPARSDADPEGQGQLEGIAGLADELATLRRDGKSVRVTVDIPSDRLIESLAYLQERSKRSKATQIVELTVTPDDVSGALVEAVGANRLEEVERALSMLLERRERVSLPGLAQGCIEWLRSNEPVGQEQLATLLRWLDRARAAETPESVLGAGADDGTLMHLVAFAASNGWWDEAAAASMLHLVVRPELPEPQAQRQSPNGVVMVRQVLATPDAVPDLAASQLAWLKQHRRGAFELVLAIARGAAEQWVDQQMRSMSEAGELSTSQAQYVRNWEYLRRVLGEEQFISHTRRMLDKAGYHKIFAVEDPVLALDCLRASELEPEPGFLDEVLAWAIGILRSTPADWEAVLTTGDTEPLLALAVRVSGEKGAPTNPAGLQDALHAHFKALAAEETAWQPEGETFAKLTRLLRAPARRALASELCAELEGRDGQVGPQLFPTYGEFLAGEPAFRTHSKLPNVVERFVARDQWEIVRWFVELAETHPDTLDAANRQDEMENLRANVAERLASAGDDAPEPLRDLAALLEEPEASPAE
jgi:hypothetical protein